MVCVRKRKLSGVALVCRRAGSERIKNVSSCVKQYYKLAGHTLGSQRLLSSEVLSQILNHH